MSLMPFAKIALHNLFHKPATLNYPVSARVYPEATRGHVAINIDSCIFCGLCSRKCPTGAITVDRTEKKWSIEPFSCIQCACCIESCPKNCLSMQQTYTQPAAKKSTITFCGAEKTPTEQQ